jgi:hypothetical protein
MFILNTLHTLLLTASSLVSYVRRYLPATSLLTSVLVYSVPASWTLTLLLGVLSLPLSVRFSFSFNNHTDPYLDTVVQSRLEFMALQQAATKQYIRELFGKWQQVQFWIFVLWLCLCVTWWRYLSWKNDGVSNWWEDFEWRVGKNLEGGLTLFESNIPPFA